MKTVMHKILFTFILAIICNLGYSQNVMEKVIEIPWNTEEGCKTMQFPSANHGIADFLVLNDKELAVLCDIEFKVKIFDLETKKITGSFDYDKNSFCYLMSYTPKEQTFYLFDGISILCYTRTGELVGRIQVAGQVLDIGVTKLYAHMESLYVSNGVYTSTIIDKGRILPQLEQESSSIEGVLGPEGDYIRIKGQENSNFNKIHSQRCYSHFFWDRL